MNPWLQTFHQLRPYEQLAVILAVIGILMGKLTGLAIIASAFQDWTWPFWLWLATAVILKLALILGYWDHLKVVKKNWRKRMREAYE